MLHKNITAGDVHYIQNWSVTDTTARDALVVTSADVGKVCEVGAAGANKAYYILSDDSPMTWMAIGGGSGTVTSVTSANADATVATTTTTPVITIVQTPALRSATTTVNVSSATAPTSGQVLTATSGTTAIWQTPAAGSGITRGTATTLTTQVNVNYSSLPAGLNRITCMWSALSINGASGWTIRLGDSGGVENTGYTGRVSYVSGTSANSYTLSSGCFWSGGVLNTNNESGVLTFVRLDGNTWMYEGSNNRVDVNTQYFMTGWKTLSAELTTVQFITGNGTDQFDNGTINIFYE